MNDVYIYIYISEKLVACSRKPDLGSLCLAGQCLHETLAGHYYYPVSKFGSKDFLLASSFLFQIGALFFLFYFTLFAPIYVYMYVRYVML